MRHGGAPDKFEHVGTLQPALGPERRQQKAVTRVGLHHRHEVVECVLHRLRYLELDRPPGLDGFVFAEVKDPRALTLVDIVLAERALDAQVGEVPPERVLRVDG